MDYSPKRQSFVCTLADLSNSDSLQNIEVWLESLRQDSPASHSAIQAKWKLETMKETAGRTPFASLDLSGLSGSFWKTFQVCLPGLTDILESFSKTWPRAGMMFAGACYRLPKWELRIREIGYGFWPTPTASDNSDREPGTPHLTRNGTIRHINKDGQQSFMRLSRVVKLWPTPRSSERQQKNSQDNGMSLSAAVQFWPTPTVNGNNNRKGASAKSGDGLATAVKMWPTPTQADGMGGPGNSGRQGGNNLRTEVGGQLNPDWVEWLMGVPIGWTDLKPLEMDKFRQWLQKFGGY